MPANRTNHVQSLVPGLFEFLGFFPVFLLLGILIFPETALYGWLGLLIGLFIVFYFINHFLSNRWYSITLGAIFSAALSFLIAPTLWAAVISSVISFIAAFRGIQHAENDWEQIMPTRIFWAICLPVYFVGYLVFTYVDALSAYNHLISYTGFLFLIIMLFVTNRQHLQKETLSKGKQKLGKEITRLNRFYLILTILAVFLITNFQVVQSALLNGVRSAAAAIIWLSSLFQREEPVEEAPPSESMPPMFGDTGEEPSPMAEWMETAFFVIGITLAIVLAVIFAAILFKKFRRAIKKALLFIWGKLQQVMGRKTAAEEQTDFSDEKESLFHWKKWRQDSKEKITQAIQKLTARQPRFDQLSIEEKVRFLYRYLAREVKKQEQWRESLTAHEVIALTKKEVQLQQLTIWYDTIRYGNQTLSAGTEAEINQLWRELQEEK